jgi:hypothetical protein
VERPREGGRRPGYPAKPSRSTGRYLSCGAIPATSVNLTAAGLPAERDRDAVSDGPNNAKARNPVPRIFCRSCASPLVQAADWEQEDETHWTLRLWCPDCGFEQIAVLDRPQVIYLTLAIEEGFACILEALAELETFVESDLTGPDVAELDLTKRARSDRIEPASF